MIRLGIQHWCAVGFAVALVPLASRAQVPPVNATPNQRAMAAYLQKVCTQVADLGDGEGDGGGAQADLADRCVYFQNSAADTPGLGSAYNAILGQQINALGPQTKKFGTLQQDNLAARLAELRHGVRGPSVSGLTVMGDDGAPLVSGGQLSDYLPAGASGDGNGEWLDGRLGVFANGSIKSGSKRASKNSFAFDISDDSATLGADYRITKNIVVGIAAGGGQTTTDFANSLGRLELRAKGVSLYASSYGDSYYVDVILGYGVPHLDTTRHIAYADPSGDVDQSAFGRSTIHDLWSGMSVGRPFDWGAFSLTPEGSINYHEIRLAQFSETMSDPDAAGSGLGLTFGRAVVPSLQGRAGLRAAYVFSGPFGVFEPNIHGTFIREFRNHPDDFSARFTNAPEGTEGAAILQTDPPEGHYFANGGGVNFQLAHSIAGFVDYEQLKTLKTIKSHEFSFGLRYQFGL
jgi:outer membrane autotransporter protein